MTNAQIVAKVKAATLMALATKADYTIIGFTSFGLVVWNNNGSCSIK